MRGQRVPIGNENTKVIRAFVHWYDEHGSEDLDLTGTFIGEKAARPRIIGWNGEKNCELGCYSGDVRHRMGSCAEYIDIDVAKTRAAGYKYVVLDVRNYNGGSLADMKDCAFGYMEREHPKANLTFKPETLANCVTLQCSATNSIMAVIDVETLEYIFLDIDQDGIPVASANYTKIVEAIKPYTELPGFSVHDLLSMHVSARGQKVKTEEEADLIVTPESFPSYVEIGKWMGI
jgi:hypothetical protein